MAGDLKGVTTGASVRVGSRVRIRDRSGVEQDIRIVGSDSEMGLYSLSLRTPLARALLGSRPGDEIKVHVDAGAATFVIIAVEP